MALATQPRHSGPKPCILTLQSSNIRPFPAGLGLFVPRFNRSRESLSPKSSKSCCNKWNSIAIVYCCESKARSESNSCSVLHNNLPPHAHETTDGTSKTRAHTP
eukprot:1977231-Pleurochrysis_carterae.AAC.1